MGDLGSAVGTGAGSTPGGCDRLAFDSVYAQYERKVYNVVHLMVGNGEDANDVTQEVFVRAYRAYGSFRGDSAVFTWLYRIAVNACRNYLRQRHRASRVPMGSLDAPADGEEGSGPVEVPDDTHDPGRVVETIELRETVRRAVAGLPEDFREALVLREFGGRSYAEIAEITGIRAETAKTRVFRARRLLVGTLGPYLRG